jgi:hypothetical protein
MKRVVLITISYNGTVNYLPSTYLDGVAWYDYFRSKGIPAEQITWLAEGSNSNITNTPTLDNIIQVLNQVVE